MNAGDWLISCDVTDLSVMLLANCLLRKSRSCSMEMLMQLDLQRMHQRCTGLYWQMNCESLSLLCYCVSVVVVISVIITIDIAVITVHPAVNRFCGPHLHNNNNKHDNVYGAVIVAEPLREFTRFI